MLTLWYPVSVFGYGSLVEHVSVVFDGSLVDYVSIHHRGSLFMDVSVVVVGSLVSDVSVAKHGSLGRRVSVTSHGLINAKLRQQRSPSVDILVTRAAEVLNERQPGQDLRLSRLNRFAPAAVNFLLVGAHGLACHWRQVALAAVAMAASQHRQLHGVFSQPCRQFEQT
jgi:hypothetical protein